MQNIQLYIEGERIDLFKDESITITDTIKNVKDVSKVFTEFSRTFNLPASKTNNRIFKHYYNNDIVNGYDARVRVKANIELNFLPFKDGYIKLEGVDLKDNKAHTYRITFFGSTVTLKNVLGEDKLSALTNLNENTLVYDADNLKAKLQADPDTNDIITPLITHSQRLTFDSHSSANNVGNVHYEAGGGSNEHGVSWDELKYAIRVDTIMQAISTNPNYNISFSDDFFNSTNKPYYNLFMWLHRKKGFVESPVANTVQTLVNTWTPYSDFANTRTRITNSTLTFIDDVSKYPVIDLRLRTSSGFSYNASIQRNGVEVYNTGNIAGDIDISKNSFATQNGSYTVIIESSQNITFSSVTWYVEYKRSPIFPIVNHTYTSAPFDHTSDFDFIINQQIPDIKIIDFVIGIFRMFNLVAYVERNKTEVIVKTLDDFYNSGGEYDITEFLDVNKSAVNVALPFKEITFEHGDAKTFLSSIHSQLFNKTWGKTEFTAGENLDGNIYKVKTPFAQLKYERLIDINTGANTSVQYGYFVDDNQQPYFGKPLLFYPILNNGNNISFQNSSSSHSEITNYNIASNSLSINPNTSKNNINFFNELNEYTAENNFTDTLFEAYHSKYILSVFNQSNRITKVTAYLPLRILLNYNLSDRFLISGKSYKINSIKTNFQNGKSEIELLNDL